MELFCFASKNLTNIWAGIGAGLWAVAETSASDMKARITKSKRMKVGALGVLYCNETHSFTTPFIVYSEPDERLAVTNIWPEKWRLPFRIHPLGSPERQVHKDEAMQSWPVLANSRGNNVSAEMNLTGTTVFVPKVISENDWALIVQSLATGA